MKTLIILLILTTPCFGLQTPIKTPLPEFRRGFNLEYHLRWIWKYPYQQYLKDGNKIAYHKWVKQYAKRQWIIVGLCDWCQRPMNISKFFQPKNDDGRLVNDESCNGCIAKTLPSAEPRQHLRVDKGKERA